jgi:DNA-binding GntR family transcriptional regulator
MREVLGERLLHSLRPRKRFEMNAPLEMKGPAPSDGRSLSEQISDSIRDSIICGEFAHGSVLRQEQLAARFGVSRIPVRESLKQLEAEGFLRLQPHRGAIVTPTSQVELDDLLKTALLLETEAIRAAAQSFAEEDGESVRRTLVAMGEATDAQSWLMADFEFHYSLYKPCRRPVLLSLVRHTRNHAHRYVYLLARATPWAGTASTQHEELLDACQKRDAHLAVSLLMNHLQNAASLAAAHMSQFAPATA